MKNKKYIIGIGIGSLLFVVVGLVKANPQFFQAESGTAAATSTMSYMTPGAATTTLTIDSYKLVQSSTETSNPTAYNGLSLAVQFEATSTGSRLVRYYEYSSDNIDWYPQNVELNINATTTIEVQHRKLYEFSFPATSTPLSNAELPLTNGKARVHKIVDVPILARYVRVNFYIPVGSMNGAVWAEFMPRKERP